MIYIILSFITGFIVILTMIINSHLAKRIGSFQGAFINYFGGLAAASFVLLITGTRHFSIIFQSVPVWVFFGGAIGVFIIFICNWVIPEIPTIYFTLLTFIGQLFTGIILDYIIGNDVSVGKVAGGILIIVGLLYNFNIDKKAAEINE